MFDHKSVTEILQYVVLAALILGLGVNCYLMVLNAFTRSTLQNQLRENSEYLANRRSRHLIWRIHVTNALNVIGAMDAQQVTEADRRILLQAVNSLNDATTEVVDHSDLRLLLEKALDAVHGHET